jgi:LmbE family N-acetylglucosaminyl deacetylase
VTTAGAFLTEARCLPVTSLDAVTAGRALILAPHPDDESLGCGGLIAEACSKGQPPLVVVFTDGAGSHPGSRAYPPARLRTIREAETLAAVACLGLDASDVVFLRYPDTQAPTEGPALSEAAGRLVALIQDRQCRTILTSWEHDPHCDHLAAHRVAALARQDAGVPHRAFPVWGLTLPPGTALPAGPAIGGRLAITPHLPAKRRAIRCHASQYAGLITDDPGGFQMEPSFMALFDGPTEIFLDVS